MGIMDDANTYRDEADALVMSRRAAQNRSLDAERSRAEASRRKATDKFVKKFWKALAALAGQLNEEFGADNLSPVVYFAEVSRRDPQGYYQPAVLPELVLYVLIEGMPLKLRFRETATGSYRFRDCALVFCLDVTNKGRTQFDSEWIQPVRDQVVRQVSFLQAWAVQRQQDFQCEEDEKALKDKRTPCHIEAELTFGFCDPNFLRGLNTRPLS